MPGALLAQDQPQPLTSVALFKVAPKDMAAFTAKAKEFTPTLDKLLADGTINSYGMDVDIIHVPEGTNVAYWYQTANFAGIQKAKAAIEGFMKANPQTATEITSLQDGSAHRDLLVRSLEYKFRKPTGGGMPVWDFSMDRVKEGMGREFVSGFQTHEKPVLEKLFADGVICGYQLDTEVVHTSEPGLYWAIICLPELGARDKVRAAFEAENAKRTEAEREKLGNLYRSLTIRADHRDTLSEAVILNGK